ncbi:unnamed protein product [Adineta ricciae]|uniref:MD-2-related lipid-recognition domain-containing protein n=1 Tax=Adineta ricciae TaxID=249248 RepID=A0A813NI50_ADIRI|nr:unnamed protein product [Adineta ricciae]CAF0851114.1 unnamed protein product [Adineta ricciae]
MKFLVSFLSFLQLTLVIAQVAWENDEDHSYTVKLLNLTIKPYPIIIPGSISVELTIHSEQPIASPLKVDLSLHKKVLFSSVPIPCISGIGSCTYDDLCSLCPQCRCPMSAGNHVITLPISIDTTSWALLGSYQVQVNVETNIESNSNEFQRYQRGFGNRRSLITHHPRHYYPKFIPASFYDQESRYLLSNPSETNEQNDFMSQQQQQRQQSSAPYH